MGTASIAHASANTSEPLQQGLMGIIEVFLDTVVICTLTAFVILCSGVSVPYGSDPGITLSMDAFANVYGNWVRGLLTLLVCVFAFATILGWGLYGARCAQYLFGHNVFKRFAWLQAAAVLMGAVVNTSTVWLLAEIVNGLMAMPNLAAILMLTPEVARLTEEYRMCYNQSHRPKKRGKTHERKGNRRDPAAHPAGSQQYDCHLRLLRQRGQGGHQQVPALYRQDARE
jgi:AGCS family alanine or glycine:cation symporter